jgi:hypothetical protein
MAFAITIWDFGLWTAVSAIMLLITAAVISPSYGRVNLLFEIRKIRSVAYFLGVGFLLIASAKIITMMFAR